MSSAYIRMNFATTSCTAPSRDGISAIMTLGGPAPSGPRPRASMKSQILARTVLGGAIWRKASRSHAMCACASWMVCVEESGGSTASHAKPSARMVMCACVLERKGKDVEGIAEEGQVWGAESCCKAPWLFIAM